MDPIAPRNKRLEKDEERDLRKVLVSQGWHVEKTHGSLYMKGWPDLYAMHPAHKQRWIEVKLKGQGRLEESQVRLFLRWRRHGTGVWVLTGPEDYPLLFRNPNWHLWMDPALRRLHGSG